MSYERKNIWLSILPRLIAFVLVAIICFIAPTQNALNYGTHWMNGVSWINIFAVYSWKLMVFEPLLWGGLLVFLLLGILAIWLTKKGAYPEIPTTLRRIFLVAAILVIAIVLYWTTGFCTTLSVRPPLPYEIGFAWMDNNKISMAFWAVSALLLQLSMKKKTV